MGYTKNQIKIEIMATKEIKLDEEQKQSIVDQVIEQIKKDFAMGDETAVDELLKFVPDENLIGFLPDVDQPRLR